MEEKINIAEILKDKPNGTKLYADAFGELSFEYIKPFFHYVSKYQGGHGGFGDILYQLMLMDKDELEIYK